MASDLWVVIPAYNEAPGITATLTALRHQRNREFRVVVVDNGSTDSTVEIVDEFASAHPDLDLTLIHEPQKGTGAAADTGMRYAIEAGAVRLARTDADCVPEPDWTEQIEVAFDDGLRSIAGQLLPRTDEGLSPARLVLMRIVIEIGSLVAKVRRITRGPQFLGTYVLTPGCNMAITAELYEAAGGFPRTRIQDEHEDRYLHNRVRTLTTDYGLRRSVRVRMSTRRFSAWGIRNTLRWYAEHRFRPEAVDIR
ncbi:glycosyltransferase [Rhodococcus sp. NPDC003382]